MTKSPEAFRTISEVAEWLDVPAHVLRFWESRFTQVKPVKRAGGRRYYRPADMELLGGIKRLLHDDGVTIRGVQKILREDGVRHVAAMSPPLHVGQDQGLVAIGADPLPHGTASERSFGAEKPGFDGTMARSGLQDGSRGEPRHDGPGVADEAWNRRDREHVPDGPSPGGTPNATGSPGGARGNSPGNPPGSGPVTPVLAPLLARLRDISRPARADEALSRARMLRRAMDARE